MLADDDIQKSTLAYPSNVRRWRPATEADCGLWFHTEVSNIILPAWFDYPAVLQKTEAKPPSPVLQIPETVDIVYDLSHPNSGKYPLVIGEWKRNLIDLERVAGKGASRVCCRAKDSHLLNTDVSKIRDRIRVSLHVLLVLL